MSDTAFHSPISLGDRRAAKVAKARPVGHRPLTSDQVEEALQAKLKSVEPAATGEERAMLVVLMLGCVLTAAGLVGWMFWS